MKLKSILGLLCLLMFSNLPAHAQLWSGVLDSSRAIDWQNAGATITNRVTVCLTVSLMSGIGNAATNGAAIRAAIANSACQNEVVFISAGTWYVDYLWFGSSGAPISNVTLRGAGPHATFIIFTTGSGCTGLGAAVCLVNADSNYSGGPSNQVTWTAGYSKGTTSITLTTFSEGAIANLHVGSLLILDQQDDTSDPGDVFVCQTAGSNGDCAQQGGVGNGRPGRAQTQTVQVTSISGSGPWTIGITPGLYASNWASGKSPGAWFSSALPITGDGIENMSLDYSTLTGGGVGIMITNGYGNWVSDVRGNNTSRSSHVQLYQSAHNTIHDSYFYGSNGTSSSYGIDTGYASSDNLIQNNICQHISTCEITEGDSGSVFAYNYAVDDYFTDPSWQQEDSYHHSVADAYTLREGNIGIGWYADDIHGTSFLLTAFRNYFSGRDSALTGGVPKTQQTSAVVPMAFTRETNIIGNVLGLSGYHTIYQTAAPNSTDPGNATNSNVSVYVLGYSGNQGESFSASGGGFTIPNDTLVQTQLYRWGNYDVVHAAVQWNSSEVPSGLSTYAQAVPSSHTLPPSFYLSAKPAFWGSMPWPPIGPDVTGGNIANLGGYAYLNPAANCYLNILGGTTDGSEGILGFDANVCYYQASPFVTLSPTSLSFGNQTTGSTSAALTETLTNTGNAPLTGMVALTAGTQFSIVTGSGAGTCSTSALSLAASASCTVKVTFSPTMAANLSDTLVFTTNAATSPNSIGVSGVGVSSGTAPAAPTGLTVTVAQ